ncbi:MAG: SsrA-binding protein SmpB [Bdellovibrio sp.]|nr:SsrA-binding protein SmpB [Bdellovibrio sp.]
MNAVKIIANNKRASYDFEIIEKFETGIVLVGTEVKSLRLGKCSLNEAHISIDTNGEAWAYNINIPHYEFGNINNHEESRKRKLLLKKKELTYLQHKAQAQGMTIVPTKIYFKKSIVKLEIALAKGKKHHDKRADTAKKDVEKRLRRGLYDE